MVEPQFGETDVAIPTFDTGRQMIQGTPQERETVCSRCGGVGTLDDIMYRGPARMEFHQSGGISTDILKPADQRPPEVLIGQICRAYVPVTEDMEEPCGFKPWHTPVYTPPRGRRQRRTQA